jgi:hypothetical protein
MSVAYGTILNERYLAHGLALYHSWRAAVRSGQFYFFAIDDGAARILRKLPLTSARVIEPGAFAHPELEAQRSFRNVGELCWASKPLAIRYMLDDGQDLEWACYLDGDMALFGDPEPVLKETGSDTFGLFTPHRFGPSMTHWIAKVGIHNAGFAAFRRSPDTGRVVERWFHDCLARPALSDRGGETFDQKILDRIVEDEPGVADLDHPGINMAPWNADNYEFSRSGGNVQVNGDDLILYHFQSLKIHGSRLFTLYNGDWRIPPMLRRLVYRPYVRLLREAIRTLQALDGDFRPPTHVIATGWKEYLYLVTLLARQRRHMVLA